MPHSTQAWLKRLALACCDATKSAQFWRKALRLAEIAPSGCSGGGHQGMQRDFEQTHVLYPPTVNGALGKTVGGVLGLGHNKYSQAPRLYPY